MVTFFFALCGCSEVTSPGAQPPTFAGAKALVPFTPDFPHIPEYAYYYLTWDPAADNVTPSSRMIYIVYRNLGTFESFDYSNIFATTEAGATREVVSWDFLNDPTAYFAVRAMDEAGNVDSNTKILSVE
ncbi:MAG: hypothetical protein V3T21_03260 [Candidatus Margulisiibacteriota bacterium]